MLGVLYRSRGGTTPPSTGLGVTVVRTDARDRDLRLDAMKRPLRFDSKHSVLWIHLLPLERKLFKDAMIRTFIFVSRARD